MVEATYTLTEAEFIEASAAYSKPRAKKLPGYMWSQVVFALFAFFAMITVLTNPLWLTIALLVSLVAIFVIQQWRKKAIPVYQASAYAEYNEEVSVKFDEEGAHTEKIGQSKSWMAWSLFTGWMETEHMFVIGVRMSWIPIPKSAFSVPQWDELRALFSSRITARP